MSDDREHERFVYDSLEEMAVFAAVTCVVEILIWWVMCPFQVLQKCGSAVVYDTATYEKHQTTLCFLVFLIFLLFFLICFHCSCGMATSFSSSR